jgi:hypothetical protein
MAAWICGNEACGTRYSVGAPCCPQCRADEPYEEGDPTMAKISRHGGPSNIEDPTMPPVINEETGERVDRQDAKATDEQHVSWTEGGRENLIEGVDEDAQARAADAREDDSEGETYYDGPGVADTDEAFDPGAHSVAEVRQYLDATDDPTEKQRVLDAEKAGRNRAGIKA